MGIFQDFADRQNGVKTGPAEGQTWQGGIDWSNGMGKVIPSGYVYSNGQWVSPLNAQTNELAHRKIGLETENLGIQNEAAKSELQAQQGYNQVASTAGQRLNTLLQDPSSLAQDPGYQFQYNQGLEAVNRTNAAHGMLGSGNRLYDLMNYGQDRAKTSYGDRLSSLGNFLNKNPMTNGVLGQQSGQNAYATRPDGAMNLSGRY